MLDKTAQKPFCRLGKLVLQTLAAHRPMLPAVIYLPLSVVVPVGYALDRALGQCHVPFTLQSVIPESHL